MGDDGAGLEESADEKTVAELVGGEGVGGFARGKVVEFYGSGGSRRNGERDNRSADGADGADEMERMPEKWVGGDGIKKRNPARAGLGGNAG